MYIKIKINVVNNKNRVYNYYFNNLIKAKRLQTKNFLIYKKNHKDFTKKSVWDDGKDWRTWRKKDLMVDDYVLDKILEKIKEIIGIEKLDKLPDDITFKNIAILVSCIIIDYGKL